MFKSKNLFAKVLKCLAVLAVIVGVVLGGMSASYSYIPVAAFFGTFLYALIIAVIIYATGEIIDILQCIKDSVCKCDCNCECKDESDDEICQCGCEEVVEESSEDIKECSCEDCNENRAVEEK